MRVSLACKLNEECHAASFSKSNCFLFKQNEYGIKSDIEWITFIKKKSGKKPAQQKSFKLVEYRRLESPFREYNSLANLSQCLDICRSTRDCVALSYDTQSLDTSLSFKCALFNSSSKYRSSQNWSSLIELEREVTIISTVEYTSFVEKYTANTLASSICYELYNNNSLDMVRRSLDLYLTDTSGWSYFAMSKLAGPSSSWNLNVMKNLFLHGTCTFSNNKKSDSSSGFYNETLKKYKTIVAILKNKLGQY